MAKDNCILCGKETAYDFETHIDMRIGYIEGAGQLCIDCFNRGNQESREHITIPKNLVLNYPNDMELGAKVRQYYYDTYNDTPRAQKQNDWICEFCGEDTSDMDYDYLAGTNHLSCALKNEINGKTSIN
jgi:hypothetical protein